MQSNWRLNQKKEFKVWVKEPQQKQTVKLLKV